MTRLMFTNEEKMEIKRRYLEAQEIIIDRLLEGDASAVADMGNVLLDIIPGEVFSALAENVTDEDCDKLCDKITEMEDKVRKGIEEN